MGFGLDTCFPTVFVLGFSLDCETISRSQYMPLQARYGCDWKQHSLVCILGSSLGSLVGPNNNHNKISTLLK